MSKSAWKKDHKTDNHKWAVVKEKTKSEIVLDVTMTERILYTVSLLYTFIYSVNSIVEELYPARLTLRCDLKLK